MVGIRFYRPLGPHADVNELEFVSAVHQTDEEAVRTDGTITAMDIKHYLRSRHSILVKEAVVKRMIIQEMCGTIEEDLGDNADEDIKFDMIDLCQVVALLIIPYLVSHKDEVGRTNVDKVFNLILNEARFLDGAAVSGNKLYLTDHLLQAVFENYGELKIPPYIIQEMLIALKDANKQIMSSIQHANQDIMAGGSARGFMIRSGSTRSVGSGVGGASMRSFGTAMFDEEREKDGIAVLDRDSFLKVLTNDVTMYNPEWEEKESTFYQDARARNIDEEEDEEEEDVSGNQEESEVPDDLTNSMDFEMATNLDGEGTGEDKKGKYSKLSKEEEEEEKRKRRKLPFKKLFTFTAIDQTADVYKSPAWIIFLWLTALVTYYSYVFGRSFDIKINCNSKYYGCTVSEAIVQWLSLFLHAAGVGGIFIVLASMGNITYKPKGVKNKVMYTIGTLISITTVAMCTTYTFFVSFSNGFIDTQKYEEPEYQAAYYTSVVVGGIVMFIQVLQIISFWTRIKSIPYLSGGTIKLELKMKQAARYKVKDMIRHALAAHYKPEKKKKNPSPFDEAWWDLYADKGDPEEAGEANNLGVVGLAQAFKNYDALEECKMKVGGPAWAWSKVIDKSIYLKDGVWLPSRLFIMNLAQLFAVLICTVGFLALHRYCTEWYDEFEIKPELDEFAGRYAGRAINAYDVVTLTKTKNNDVDTAIFELFRFFNHTFSTGGRDRIFFLNASLADRIIEINDTRYDDLYWETFGLFDIYEFYFNYTQRENQKFREQQEAAKRAWYEEWARNNSIFLTYEEFYNITDDDDYTMMPTEEATLAVTVAPTFVGQNVNVTWDANATLNGTVTNNSTVIDNLVRRSLLEYNNMVRRQQALDQAAQAEAVEVAEEVANANETYFFENETSSGSGNTVPVFANGNVNGSYFLDEEGLFYFQADNGTLYVADDSGIYSITNGTDTYTYDMPVNGTNGTGLDPNAQQQQQQQNNGFQIDNAVLTGDPDALSADDKKALRVINMMESFKAVSEIDMDYSGVFNGFFIDIVTGNVFLNISDSGAILVQGRTFAVKETQGTFMYVRKDKDKKHFIYIQDYFVDFLTSIIPRRWQFFSPLMAGGIFGLISIVGAVLILVPSYISTCLKYRYQVIDSLFDPNNFLKLRKGQEQITLLIGSAFWGTLISGLVAAVLMFSIFFILFWSYTRDWVLMVIAQVIGILATIIMKIGILMLIRSFIFTGGFYRNTPFVVNVLNVILECWNVALTAGYMVLRSLQLTLIMSFYLARVDTPMLAPGVGYIKAYNLDFTPEGFQKDLLAHEAHRHPYIERLGLFYLMKLRHGEEFGKRCGSYWRLLFVLALMPWMQNYRVTSRDEDPDSDSDDEDEENGEGGDREVGGEGEKKKKDDDGDNKKMKHKDKELEMLRKQNRNLMISTQNLTKEVGKLRELIEGKAIKDGNVIKYAEQEEAERKARIEEEEKLRALQEENKKKRRKKKKKKKVEPEEGAAEGEEKKEEAPEKPKKQKSRKQSIKMEADDLGEL